ncbi:MAG: hypothetical protein HYX51_07540 [Chloroflexi bacterium]|nr:hypothetical protein [Chloroflexota bacterium]
MTKRDLGRDMRPMPEEDDISQWIDATMEERGRALASLLGFVDAVGRYPAKDDLLVVFPPRRRTHDAT